MSTRILNPIMADSCLNLTNNTRVVPNRNALARVRRDLFGPVDHAAALALAESELHAQSVLDTQRWGFDFRLEIPITEGHSRYEWEVFETQEIVPEPYALRGMSYLQKHASTMSKEKRRTISSESQIIVHIPTTTLVTKKNLDNSLLETCVPLGEMTPFREHEHQQLQPRLATSLKYGSLKDHMSISGLAPRKQKSITDFMNIRKRTLNGMAKKVTETPEKISRTSSQIRR